MTLNREAYLQALTDKLRPVFEVAGYPLRDTVHVSVGFPSTRATAKNKRRIGECWPHVKSADGNGHIFISPVLSDVGEVAAVLVHELIHDQIGTEHGHKGPFKRAMKALGLEGKPTATHAGEALVKELKALTDALGEYPHPALTFDGKEKRQTTRQIKCACGACGYVARVARKWLEVGAPMCPTHKKPMSIDAQGVRKAGRE